MMVPKFFCYPAGALTGCSVVSKKNPLFTRKVQESGIHTWDWHLRIDYLYA